MRLSEHFTLSELTTTTHTEIDNTPTAEDLERLRALCQDFLEPVRARFGPVYIHSGYRSRALNDVLPGSAKRSAHMSGCAADFHVGDGSAQSIRQVVEWIRDESGLPFDQVIDECKGTGRWVHLGATRPGSNGPRHQVLSMRDGCYFQFGL